MHADESGPPRELLMDERMCQALCDAHLHLMELMVVVVGMITTIMMVVVVVMMMIRRQQ